MSVFRGLGWTIYTLNDDAKDLLESLPEATQKIRQTARSHRAAACVLNVAPCIGSIALTVAFAPVGALAFGRLWGRVLGVPVLMMAKAICDRVDDLKPIGELLGN